MGGMEILITWLALALAGCVATVWWSVRMWKRSGELKGWMRALAGIVAASAAIGSLGTLVGLVKAFGATGGESVDPSQKARILAEGISEAMNCTAAGLLLWLPSVIALTVIARRRKTKSG
jgi:biopolymer transport protein ExbB/TolQ